MKIYFSHSIIRNPQPENEGTITVNAKIDGYNPTFTGSSFAEQFLDEDNDECRCKEYFNYFLMESGIGDDDTIFALINNYSTGDELLVSLRLIPTFQIGDAIPIGEEYQMEEAVRASLEETNNISLRPASKLVVKSLARKIYKMTTSSTGEMCIICLEEFSEGRRVVTLPCGHDFDDECVLKWFETNHSCPLCRFKLPYQ
ncbi:Zinc finger RING-type [Arabidopsis thaliana x Arabidopsis arenosa]|uniref:Zinc finger RING-type n=1 Tax=Arabidopsis thaliana x Arabidopsis arenosa TaxID=1240361 RepID=A0A8T2GFK3_9BRAS|nr:Zinc finger RING-type [Arabidopsis thaliana x Arabidopsis arenosa]